jgi:hypothetical protein
MWLIRILQLTRSVSPELKSEIRECLAKMEAHAKATELAVDDAAVGVLKTLCAIAGLI